MATAIDNNHYTTAEVCEALDLSPYTLRKYARYGLLTPIQVHGRLLMWPAEPVNRLVTAGLRGSRLSAHVLCLAVGLRPDAEEEAP